MKIRSKMTAVVAVVIATFAIGSLTVTAANAKQDSLEGWYTWETTYTGTEAPTAGTITWPQYLVGKGHANDLQLECGVWYQTDRYEGKDKDIEKVIEDGILSHNGKPEDHKIVKEWEFVYGGDCALPEDASASVTIAPATCTDGETLVWGDAINATWNEQSTQTGTEGPGDYGVRANANEGHLFPAGLGVNEEQDKWTQTGTLAGPDESLCEHPVYDEGEDSEAVSLCTADGFATITTTTTAWTSVDGVKTYGEPVVTTEVVADAGCDEDEEAPTPEPVTADPEFAG